MDRKKCYIYIRVSTSMQEDGYSLDAQKERLTKFAEFQNFDIVREYCDAGRSGKSINGRPEFQHMLQDVAEGTDGAEYILVFKLSRFGRNAADVLNSLQYIQDFGVNLICVEDGIDSSKDSGKLTITVLSAVAEIERENILVQTMEGRKQKAREGKWNGGTAPYGYRLDRNTEQLVMVPEEAEVVRLIFDKFLNGGMGFESISNYLNERGYTKNKNRVQEITYFTRNTVKNIIDNPVYMGKIAYGRRKQEKVKGTRDQYRRICADDYLMVDAKHEAVIDEQTWMDAQERRKATGVAWQKTHSLEHEHILSGILKCPLCGLGLGGTVRRRRNKKTGEYKDDFYYRCQHRKWINGHKCDYAPSLSEDKMNLAVEEVILDMTMHEDFRNFVIRKMEEEVDAGILENELEQLKDKLRQAVGAKNKLTQMLDNLDVNDRHYERKYQDMHDRLDNLYDKVEEIEEAISAVNAKLDGIEEKQLTEKQLYAVLKEFDKLYYRMSDMEKKDFMQAFIKEIELYPDETDIERILKRIEFRFPVYYKGSEGYKIRLLSESTVETVILLSGRKADAFAEVELELNELNPD